MAQQTTGDFDIVPGSTPGETLAAILNRNNAANITMHSGSTAPTYLLNGMLWLDTTSSTEHIAKYYNSGDTSWIELFRVTTATGLIVFSAETAATTAYHLTNKTYVDNADNLKLNLTGGSVSDVITSSVAASADNDLIRKVEAELLMPVGTMINFAGTSAPTGYLGCDGSEVSQSTYSDLFTAISTTWDTTGGAAAPAGGNFRLPPQQIGNLGVYERGVGTTNGAVGTYEADVFKSHKHNIYAYDNAGVAVSRVAKGSGVNGTTLTAPIIATGDATETRPRSITVLKCIKY